MTTVSKIVNYVVADRPLHVTKVVRYVVGRPAAAPPKLRRSLVTFEVTDKPT